MKVQTSGWVLTGDDFGPRDRRVSQRVDAHSGDEYEIRSCKCKRGGLA